jgi:hypothetical protein
VAIGLVGIVATASLSTLSGTATSGADAHSYNAAELSVSTAGPVAMGAVDSASGSVEPPALAPLGASPAASPTSGVQDAAGTTGPGNKAVPPAPAPSPQVASSDGAGSPDRTQAALATSTGLDARLIWLGGFGLLFLAGLGVLIVPLIRRRRAR